MAFSQVSALRIPQINSEILIETTISSVGINETVEAYRNISFGLYLFSFDYISGFFQFLIYTVYNLVDSNGGKFLLS